MVLLGLAGSSQAQSGSGWSTMSWSRIIQKTGWNAYYSNSGGVESFRISPGDTRSEVSDVDSVRIRTRSHDESHSKSERSR
jgi:hypothetical protein